MVYPTDDPVVTLIMDDLVTAIDSITGASYRTTIRTGQTQVVGRNPIQKLLFPCATLTPPRVSWSDDRYPLLAGTLFTTVSLFSIDRTNTEKTIRDFVTDAIQALVVVDHTRGGVARDTHVLDSEEYVPFGEDGVAIPIVAADLAISVTFAQLRTDPSSAK